MKKRIGRPPVPAAKRREQRITLGVNSEEYEKIAALAKAEGVSQSVWARDVLLRVLRRRSRT